MAPTVDAYVFGRPRSIFENVNIKDGFCGLAAGLDGQGGKESACSTDLFAFFTPSQFFPSWNFKSSSPISSSCCYSRLHGHLIPPNLIHWELAPSTPTTCACCVSVSPYFPFQHVPAQSVLTNWVSRCKFPTVLSPACNLSPF